MESASFRILSEITNKFSTHRICDEQSSEVSRHQNSDKPPQSPALPHGWPGEEEFDLPHGARIGAVSKQGLSGLLDKLPKQFVCSYVGTDRIPYLT